MPLDKALGYMKEAAAKSYMSKGQDIVDMNYHAIDAGASAFHQVAVPKDWVNAAATAQEKPVLGRAATVKMVENIQRPVDMMNGDSIPVSAFLDHADGSFELGASAYEKRGVAVTVPSWDPDKCLQCNNCAFSCPHACLRPFVLTPEEAAAAPEGAIVQAEAALLS